MAKSNKALRKYIKEIAKEHYGKQKMEVDYNKFIQDCEKILYEEGLINIQNIQDFEKIFCNNIDTHLNNLKSAYSGKEIDNDFFEIYEKSAMFLKEYQHNYGISFKDLKKVYILYNVFDNVNFKTKEIKVVNYKHYKSKYGINLDVEFAKISQGKLSTSLNEILISLFTPKYSFSFRYNVDGKNWCVLLLLKSQENPSVWKELTPNLIEQMKKQDKNFVINFKFSLALSTKYNIDFDTILAQIVLQMLATI